MSVDRQQLVIMAAAAAGLGFVLYKHQQGREAEAVLNGMSEAAQEADEVPDVNIMPEADEAAEVSEAALVENSERGLLADIKRAFARPEAKALVPATFLAFGLLDAVPIPTDIGYFYTEKWLQDNKDKLSPSTFWLIEYFNYYGWDVAWYLSLFLITYYGGVTSTDKLHIGLWLVSTGVISTLLWRFTLQDQAQKQQQQLPAAA